MNKPKTQAELLKIIEEQEKQIKMLKHAMNNMDKMIKHLAILSDRNKGNIRKTGDNLKMLQDKVKVLANQ